MSQMSLMLCWPVRAVQDMKQRGMHADQQTAAQLLRRVLQWAMQLSAELGFHVCITQRSPPNARLHVH